VTARRPKRFKVHWRSTEPAARIPQRLHPGTQVVVPRDQPFAGQTPLSPFFAFLSGASQRVPRGTQALVTSIDQQFVDHRLLAPLLTSSGLRMLVLGLILVALMPNLILGGLIWLDVINTPWSKHETAAPDERSVPAVRSAIPLPVLTSPTQLEATPGELVSLPIALDGTDGVPVRSIIAIRGLPQGSKLSSGRPYDETEWNLKPDEIGDLHLALTGNESSEANVIIQLVAPDGAIIADAATVLKVTTDSNIKAELAQPQVRDVQTEGLGAIGGEDKVANVDAATVSGNSVPLPSRRPEPTANDDGSDWIKALAFVNLRQRPTRSAPAISVVAKGAKLRVMGRKKGWLQVSNPATSELGWIYAANIAAVR
jgi:hypothetical protein